MSHAHRADRLLIKPTAGTRPASPRSHRQIIPKAHEKRPVPRRVTCGTTNTRLATTPDRPTHPVSQSHERVCDPQLRQDPDMRVPYDGEVDAAYISLRWIAGQVIDSEEGFRRWAS
jgi:hypothetical protein